MHKQYEHLLSQGEIGRHHVKNRLIVAPMSRTSATKTGEATEAMMHYYAKFARGGYGLIIAEGTYSDITHSQGYWNQPGIATQQHVQAWEKITNAVHQAGSLIVLQLMHAGSQVLGNAYRTETIAPSPVRPKGEKLAMVGGSGPYDIPREMTRQEINDVIQSFADATKRAREAGFDGVEVHGANGYLLDQFLTDYMNQRSDEYGGTIMNRLRFMLEIIRAVKKSAGEDFIIGVRISQGKATDFEHKWAGKQEDAKLIFTSLAQEGVDYIHVTEYDAIAPAFEENGPSLAALAKQYAKSIPIIANGQLDQPDKAEAMLARGEADFISLGKGALANQDYVHKLEAGKSPRAFDYALLQPTIQIKEQEQ
ncbi:NADH:flavin oxidoreductase [Cohnella sp. GCM10027633]|uniref:oxidoreductase n=1 Tax=unclassified Cohnella TaxID=2636738 RepID=UPI003631F9D0